MNAAVRLLINHYVVHHEALAKGIQALKAIPEIYDSLSKLDTKWQDALNDDSSLIVKLIDAKNIIDSYSGEALPGAIDIDDAVWVFLSHERLDPPSGGCSCGWEGKRGDSFAAHVLKDVFANVKSKAS